MHTYSSPHVSDVQIPPETIVLFVLIQSKGSEPDVATASPSALTSPMATRMVVGSTPRSERKERPRRVPEL